MKTYSEASSRIDWYEGKYINFDGVYGMQCMDLAVDYVYWLTGIRMWGNARDAINNDFEGQFTVCENTPSFQQQRGDIAVFTRGAFDNLYGHIAIVYNSGDLNGCMVLEQNWDGQARTPATLRWDDCSGISHFIRPNYKNETLFTSIKKKAPQKNTKYSTVTLPFNAAVDRGRSLTAYVTGTIDNLGAEVRKRSGNRVKGFNWNRKAGYELKPGDVIYIFEIHNGWGRIYTGNLTGKGSNDWIWLGRMKVNKVFK
ncbi:Putative cell wall hydrolase LytN [Macrococcoides canis]|uniref:Putative cell wall hydrolase LytN n=1 Tax=Macrococcoides canis TaxID=1855823 RepID=A0A1W7ACD2_9STAP|nr:CHAP domain-containing protein [Macrococcus canis]ARQ07275.1 putative cell wall hydrolase LytN precursor [Macrococcus canis]